MVEQATLARPYAQAAFDVAKEANALSAWSAALKVLSMVVQDPKVAAYIISPKPTSDELAAQLLSLCDGELGEPVKNFVKILAENKRLALLPAMTSAFEHLKTQAEGRLKVNVACACDLTEAHQQSLRECLSKKLKRDVTLDVEVDASLMGGMIIRYDDVVMDGSVKNKLERLQVTLQD